MYVHSSMYTDISLLSSTQAKTCASMSILGIWDMYLHISSLTVRKIYLSVIINSVSRQRPTYSYFYILQHLVYTGTYMQSIIKSAPIASFLQCSPNPRLPTVSEHINDFVELAAPVPEKRCRLVKYQVPAVACKVSDYCMYNQ